MSQSTLRRERVKVRRTLSAPKSITFSPSMTEPRFESKAEMKLILENLLTSQDRLRANQVCTEVGQELQEISYLVEKELQTEKSLSFTQKVKNILAAIRSQEVHIWEPFFEALESLIGQQVCTKTFVNITAFGIAIVRRYKEELPNSTTNWVISLVVELMMSAYERYRIYDWIQQQGGWRGVLELVRRRYQTFVDYAFPLPRRLGSWRQIAVGSGVMIGVVVVSAAGIWFYK